MNDKEINERIGKAFVSATPDIRGRILSDAGERKENMTNIIIPKKKKILTRAFAGIAACLIVAAGIFAGGFLKKLNRDVVSTVSLDVNPGIEIDVNRKERVLEVRAMNADAERVIGDMDFTGSTLDVTVNALIGSMLGKGYISTDANSVLISVVGGSEGLRERLTAEITELLDTDGISGAVLSQNVTVSDEVKKAAEKYGITEGKAQLIDRIIKNDPRHTFETLAGLSINELNLISAGKTLDNVSSSGKPSENLYIGAEKAKNIALAHASVAESDARELEVGFDTEDGMIVYEVEFKSAGYEYDYEIDAKTGNIIKAEKEADDDVPPTTDTPDTGSTITAEEAKAIALKHAGVKAENAVFDKTEKDHEDGRLVYEVEFKSAGYEYDYEIDAKTGEILKAEKESDDVEPPIPDTGDTITADEAKSIALKHAGVKTENAVFDKTEKDYEDGRLVYEVEFKSAGYEYDYEIDAKTGEILKAEKDIDD